MTHDSLFTRNTIRLLVLLIVACGLGTAVLPISAQGEDDLACPALVEQALFQLGSNCGGLGRNTACYGYNRVDATFSEAVAEGFFSTPADRTELASLQTIQTAPLDLDLEQWGIAVMNVQANVPDTLPGQAVTFLLLGDTEVENAVSAAEAGSGPATAITQQDAELRDAAGTTSNVIGQIAAGTVLQIDATSADDAWLKVTSSLGSGWITHAVVNPTAAIDALPVEGQAQLSPMQSFYFRNGPTETTCEETPSALAIRSPENITVDLTANGANIRLGSLVMLKVLPGGDEMQLTTLEGLAILDADTANAVNVPAGMTTTRCLTDADNLGSDGESNDQEVGEDCAWAEPTVAPPELLTQGEIVRGSIIQLNLDQGAIIPIEVTPTPPPGDECPVGTTITHIVSAGENLFRIGLRYRTGMGAIMQANNLTNPQLIYTGQALIIPCGVDTGLPSVPQPPIVPTLDVVVTTPVDCRPFRATSPLDGLSYGQVTFYWDAAPGATGYRVNIYNLDEKNGALVGSFLTQGAATNLTVDATIESIGYGFSFAWEVQALYNGQVACASQRYNVPRQAQPAPSDSVGASGFSASWACSSLTLNTLIVSFSNVPAGDTIVLISFSNSFTGGPTGGSFSVPPTSASIPFSPVLTVTAGVVTSSPSGTSVTLPGVLAC